MSARARSPVFYGWIVLGGVSCTEIVSWGILYYGFGVFVAPMRAELGWSTSQLAGAFSVGLLASALVAIPLGKHLDRHGARGVMVAGSCAATFLLIAWSQVRSLWAFYAIWAGLGAAMAAVLYEPAFALVVAWFVRRRAEALSVLTSFGGLASTVFVPIATWLVERFSWRTALVVLAVILGVVTIPVHAFVLRSKPQDIGTVPDGEPSAPMPEVPVVSPPAPAPWVEWTLAAAFAVATLSAAAAAVHVIPFLIDRGYSLKTSSLAIAAMGASQVPGRLFFAPLARRADARWLGPTVFGLQAAGLIALMLATRSGLSIAAFAVLFGIGNGLTALVRSTVVADWYGAARFGTVSGKIASTGLVARAAGPILVALLAARFGGYEAAWLVLAGCVIAGALLLVTVQRARP